MEGSEINQGQELTPKSKKNLATILSMGIIIGFLVILFAVTIIIINFFPMENKWTWFLYEASIGTRILLIGAGLVEFFFALTVCIYIWKKGQNYLMKHI